MLVTEEQRVAIIGRGKKFFPRTRVACPTVVVAAIEFVAENGR